MALRMELAAQTVEPIAVAGLVLCVKKPRKLNIARDA
jgi:hypothetical protein